MISNHIYRFAHFALSNEDIYRIHVVAQYTQHVKRKSLVDPITPCFKQAV